MELTRDGMEIAFTWVPGHVGNRRNLVADTAAKDALDEDISGKLIPFSDLKSHVNRYVLELWQSEWKEFPENKLHKIISKLKGLHNLSSDKQKRRDCDISTAHWSLFYYSFLFIEGRGATGVFRM